MANRIVQAIYDLKDNVTAKLRTIGESWRGANNDADKAAAGFERSNKRTSDSFGVAAAAVGKFRAVLAALASSAVFIGIKNGIQSILGIGEEFDDLGKKFKTAFGGLDDGAGALSRVRELAENVPFSFEEIADAAVRLKQRGFDPLDGTLQALVDNTVATDGSAQDLIETIDALGKAALKGEIGTRALVSLTEKGIPVFELLGNALGKSTDEIRRMAETGQLGATEIRLLVAELGKLRAGAAASEVGDLDAQLVKLRDTLRQVAADIAGGGSLETARDTFASINDQVRELANSPEFQKLKAQLNDTFKAGVAAAGEFAKNINFAKLIGEVQQLTSLIGSMFRVLEVEARGLAPVFNALNKLTEPWDFMKAAAISAVADITTQLEQLTRTSAAESVQIKDNLLSPLALVRNEIELGKIALDAFNQAKAKIEEDKEKVEAVAAAFKALGVDAQNAGLEITEAGEKAIASLQLLANEATVTGAGFRAAFNKAIDSASTVAEIQAMERALRQAYDNGKISAADYGVGAGKAAAKTLEIKQAADLASGAIGGIGKAAEAQARQSIAALEATRSSLAGLAATLSRDLAEAIKSGADPSVIAELKKEIAATEAQVRSLTGEIDATKSSLEQTAAAGKQAFGTVKESAREAAVANEQIAESTRDTGTAIGGILGQLVSMYQRFQAVSPAAFEFFKEAYNGSVRLSTSLGSVAEKIARAEKATVAAIDNQKSAALAMQRQFEDVAASGENAGLAFVNAAKLGEAGLRNFAAAAREGQGQLELLNQADLDNLAASAERAAEKVASIKAQAAAAVEELAELNRSLQDQLDERAGNQAAIEQRNFEDELARIDQLQREGGMAAEHYANRARDLLRRNHDERMAQLAREAEAQRRADEEAARRQQAATQQRGRDIRPQQPTVGGGGGIGTVINNITVNGAERPGADLAREVARQIAEQMRRRR